MRIRKLTYLAAAAAVALTAAVAASAPASAATSDVLTVSSVGGANVNVGDVLTAPLSSPGVFTVTGGSISCPTGSFTASVTGNPAAGTGNATESVTGLTFTASTCTDTIPGTSGVSSVGLASPATGTVSDTAGTLTLTSLNVKVVLKTLLGTLTCNYGTSGSVTVVVGTLSNTGNKLVFVSATVNLITGSSLCPSTGKFSATFSPITDTTQAAKPVFLN
jgi:hypothetical protein